MRLQDERKSTCAAVLVVLSAALVFSQPPAVRAEGMLSLIRGDVRNGTSSESSSSDHQRKSRDRDDWDDGDGGFFGEFFGSLLYDTLRYGHHVASASWDPNQPAVYFSPYPYDETDGYLMKAASYDDKVWSGAESLTKWCDAEGTVTWRNADGSALSPDDPRRYQWPTERRRWGGQFLAEYANTWDDLEHVSGRLLLESAGGFGFDGEVVSLDEALPDGTHDTLRLGDANVHWLLGKDQEAIWRIGVGVNWLDDHVDTDYGFNFTLNGDMFLKRPYVLTTGIDWGTLGHAGLFRYRVSLGRPINRFEPYVGYEYLDIGSTSTNSLLAGLRLWF